MLFSNKGLAHKLMLLENRIGKHDGEIKAIFNVIWQLMSPMETKKNGNIRFWRENDG